MAQKQLSDGYHLSLSIGKALWDDLVGAALPVRLKKGHFDVGRMVYRGVKQLQVRERVVALLEDRRPPEVVVRAKDRAAVVWRNRREQVYTAIQDLLQVDGEWKVELDREGTEFHYATQKIGLDAQLKATATGTARLLRQNIEVPFTIEKRLGATCHLGNIRYDKQLRAVVGEITDPSIHFGEHVVLRLLEELAARILDQQLERFNPVPILKKDQIESMVAPAGGPLRLKMGVDDVQIEVTEENLTLKVRFGFTQLQLEGA